MPLLLAQKSLYVCTACEWHGPAKGKRSSSRKSNNHTARKPDCPYGPCLVLERAPGQSDKEAAEAYLARCTPEQCDMGMPPTGGCAPCMPTPEGREEGYQWVAVQIPEGKGPGETFEHLNHNGRYTMTVTVPEVAKAGEILGVEMGNKRKTSALTPCAPPPSRPLPSAPLPSAPPTSGLYQGAWLPRSLPDRMHCRQLTGLRRCRVMSRRASQPTVTSSPNTDLKHLHLTPTYGDL